MKVAVDISIFTSAGGAFGNATGTMELDIVPQVGDTISFVHPKVTGLSPVAGFTGLLRVTDRVLNGAGGSEVSLALDDIIVPTLEDARALVKYLEKGFGLGIDTY